MSLHPANGKKHVKVLVVDDYAPMADYLAKALCSSGHEAVAAYSGDEALRVAETFTPHALLADIMMPEMNGVELACAFGEKFPECRALLMSATQLAPEIFVGRLRLKVLQKPFELETVLEFLADTAT